MSVSFLSYNANMNNEVHNQYKQLSLSTYVHNKGHFDLNDELYWELWIKHEDFFKSFGFSCFLQLLKTYYWLDSYILKKANVYTQREINYLFLLLTQ
jgi:hypothetical protein